MNKWAKYILVICTWGLLCGIVNPPLWVAFVGGLMLGFWYSPYWRDNV